MSNKRYIEVFSARRNRTRYPLVSYFEIPIEESGLKNTASTAYDPVINAFPCYTFKLNFASSTPATSAVYPFSGGGGKRFGSGSTRFTPVLDTAPSNGSINGVNWYNGYRIIDTTINETRTITSYTPSTQTITMNMPFSSVWSVNDCYIIIDPSVPFCNDVTNVAGKIGGTPANPVLDFSGAAFDINLYNFPENGFPAGYFTGTLLQILKNNLVVEERTITDFVQLSNPTFYQVSLDNNFTFDWSQILNYDFKIIWLKTFIHLQPGGIFDLKNPAPYNQYYTGDIVFNEVTNEGRKITAYTADLKVAVLESPFTDTSLFNPKTVSGPTGMTGSCAVGPVGVTGAYSSTGPSGTGTYYPNIFSIRKDIPCYVGGYTGAAKGNNYICFNPNEQLLGSLPDKDGTWGTSTRSPDCCTPYQLNNKYVYIRPVSFGLNDAPSDKNIYMIKEYFGSSGYSGPLGTYGPYCALLDKSISLSLGGTGICEVLPFSYDNFAPLCYNGSTVSQQEQVCYEVKLLSIVLPNLILTNGARISFYPFVYVQFGTTTGSSMNHSNCSIYSNNPDGKKALFIAPTTDVSNPLTSQFIKLDGQGAIQTIKFKPNENLVFSVFLPNGELFVPVEPDYYSPKHPNPLVQVEAVFEIKRL